MLESARDGAHTGGVDERYRSYIEGYERRKEAALAARRARADRARAALPELAALCRDFGASRVRVFGSLATGRLGYHPDIDLAVEGVPPERFFELHAALVDRAPVMVDLVDVRTAPPVLRRFIEADGIDL